MTLDDVIERAKSRDGAVAALGAAAVVTAMLIAVPVILLFRSQDAEISGAIGRLARLRAEAAAAPSLTAQLDDTRRRAGMLPGVLQATSTALAQSQLQQAMETIAKDSGAAIRSAQILPVAAAHGFETISIQYDLAVPMSRLRDLVYAIETHTPYLFLDGVQAAGSQPWQQNGAQAQDPQLSIRWTVRAYRWSAP